MGWFTDFTNKVFSPEEQAANAAMAGKDNVFLDGARPGPSSRGKTTDKPSVGPLAKLETSKYTATQSLSYPLTVENNKQYPHYLKININAPASSKYTTEVEVDPTTTGVTNANKAESGQFVAATGDEIAFGGAGAGVIQAAIEASGDVAQSAKAGSAFGKQTLTNAQSAVEVGVGSAAVGAAILASIDVSRKTKRLLQSINLYIPDQVVMSTQNKYGEVSMTQALGTAGLAAQAGGAIGQNIKESLGIKSLGTGVQKAAGATPFIGEAAASVLGTAGSKLGVTGEGVDKLIMQSFGVAQNPQIEILFETVDNRTFEFTFNFHPRNENESWEVMSIIHTLRFHAAPELVAGTRGRYYMPPSEFDLQYMFNGSDGIRENEALHKFATCVLEAIDVNYVGQSGQFTTFSDGRPVQIEMRLRFKEIEIIHKDLINKGY